MTSNTDVDLTSQCSRSGNVDTTSFPRRITTFKQPFIDVVCGCSDVDTTLSRRRDETLEQRRVSTSYEHFHCDLSRRHSDVGIQRWNDVDTTSSCLLG